MSDLILEKFVSKNPEYINVSAMIIYNTILNSPEMIDETKILIDTLKQYEYFLKEASTNIPDFLHILLEYFICECNEIVAIYEQLEDDFKKHLLYYIDDHVENESNQ